eukprot:CAMPEP_0118642784 /NCGR_PEP_ID=MMETSP0785-20121206/6019_1 /TAXON_ID=91992 /ORGANISM="Bolidomonas pacifica, Strain CCMP 1866" /LENGTH=35 /DNA_ID= /DNA_START= /DNA_END= /DNA_ORIENTATION=
MKVRIAEEVVMVMLAKSARKFMVMYREKGVIFDAI